MQVAGRPHFFRSPLDEQPRRPYCRNISNTHTTEAGANLNTSNFGWHSTLAVQLAAIASNQRRDERNADEQVSALLDTVGLFVLAALWGALADEH